MVRIASFVRLVFSSCAALSPAAVEGFSAFLPRQQKNSVFLNSPRCRADLYSRCSPTPNFVPKMIVSQGEAGVKRSPVVADPCNHNATRCEHTSLEWSIRNVALIGHSHCGKTALAEWMLYDDKVISKRPTSGDSFLDSDPAEAARHSSVFSHFIRVPHRGHLLEVSDTPWGDFQADASAALDGADSAVVVVSASDGVQAGTINAYRRCRDAGIKTILALSKMDRPFLDVSEVLLDIEVNLGVKPIPLQVVRMRKGDEDSDGGGDHFEGIDPLLVLDKEGNPMKNENGGDGLAEAWTALEEAVAMTDDDLLVDYLDKSQLDAEQVFRGLRLATRMGKIAPLVYTSAESDLGVSELMDAIVAVLPNPVEMREDALKAACESDEGKCGMEPGVEAGFAGRVLHTTVDSFGSLSVLRVISNGREDDNDGSAFLSLPHEVVNLRTGEKIKMPSASTSYGLCGKERLPLADGAHVVPGDVVAVPKLPESVRTNDILTIPAAVKEEEAEISIEAATNVLTPLSRPADDVPLMFCATVSIPDAVASKKSKGRSTGGDDKLVGALEAMAREDLAMRVEQDSGMLLLRCMSKDHLQLVSARLKDRYGLEVELGQPPVQYRETLVKEVTNIEGRHKKQSGGSGQFGVCYISMEPLEEGTGVEFESRIKGGAISKTFIASVEKGVREQLQSGGPLAGYPVTDVRVTVTDGKMHSVDSKDIAFQSAGKLAVKAALERGGSRVLQPMETVTFVVDENLQGEINTIVSRQSGYVTGSNPISDGIMEVEAIVPTANIAEVSNVLRAKTAGEGQYTSEFSHYQAVPDELINSIIENSPNRHK